MTDRAYLLKLTNFAAGRDLGYVCCHCIPEPLNHRAAPIGTFYGDVTVFRLWRRGGGAWGRGLLPSVVSREWPSCIACMLVSGVVIRAVSCESHEWGSPPVLMNVTGGWPCNKHSDAWSLVTVTCTPAPTIKSKRAAQIWALLIMYSVCSIFVIHVFGD